MKQTGRKLRRQTAECVGIQEKNELILLASWAQAGLGFMFEQGIDAVAFFFPKRMKIERKFQQRQDITSLPGEIIPHDQWNENAKAV